MGRLSDIPLEIAERLDYPAESVAGVPKLTVTGRRRTRVCLRGTDLQLVAMDSAAVLISGTIGIVR